MRGIKLAAAIIAIIEGLCALVSGILIAIGGAILESMVTEMFEMVGFGSMLTLLPFSIMTFFIVVGGIVAVIGLIYFILGIRFCKRKSGKGTAVALLIFSLLMANPVVLVLTIIYLIMPAEQNQGKVSDNNF